MWGKSSKAPPEPPATTRPLEQCRPEIVDPSVSAAPLATRIGPGIVIEGEVTAHEDIHIDGEVRGELRATNAKIQVGKQGHVRADLEAREIEVHGRVDGLLRGQERVCIGASGVVHGGVLTQRIAIDEGAILQGSVDIVQPGSAQRVEARGVAGSLPSPREVAEPVNEHDARSESASPVEAT